MAYVYSKTDEEKDQGGGGATQQAGGGQNLISDTTAGTISGGGAGAGGGGGDGGATAGAAPGARSGSGWTNLQSYASANQGEPERGAQTIAADIRGKREKTGADVEQFGQTQVSGYDKVGDTFLDDLKAGRAAKDKTKSLYGQGYKGPGSAAEVGGFADTQGAVEQFGRQSAALGDTDKIIEEYTPGANIGEKSLDKFFYQQKPAQEIFAKEATASEGVADQWAQAKADVQARVDAEKRGLDTQRGAIRGAFDQGLAGIESGFNPNANQEYVNEQNAARQQEFQNFIREGAGRGQQLGDLSAFGDQVGYDFDRMYDYGGDKSLGDYVDDTRLANYRNYLGDYGDIFGATDRFGGAGLANSGAGAAVGGADQGQLEALRSLSGMMNRGLTSHDQGSLDRLASILGIQGIQGPLAGAPLGGVDGRRPEPEALPGRLEVPIGGPVTEAPASTTPADWQRPNNPYAGQPPVGLEHLFFGG